MQRTIVLSFTLVELTEKGPITTTGLRESGDIGANDSIQAVSFNGASISITIATETVEPAKKLPVKRAAPKKRAVKKAAPAKKVAPKKAPAEKTVAKKKPAKATRKGGAKQATIERFLTSKVADLKKVPAPAIEALTKGGITTVAQLLTKSQDELLAIAGFDGEALKALKKVLTYHKQKLARKKVGKKA